MNIINSNLSFRGGLTYGNNPRMLVLHHADALRCSIEDIHRWHLDNGWSGCGYHYLVRKDGSIYTGRPERAIGAHALSYNAVSIGICSEGNFNTETMGAAQYNSLLELTRSLCGKYGINRICGHKELNSTDCPGGNFPLDRIKRELGAYASGCSYPGYLLMINPISRDENVRAVQSKLIERGYNVGNCGADGYFGTATLDAVKRFQCNCGIAIDGVVGVNTWNMLMR